MAPGGVTLADLATGFSRVGDSSGSDDFVGKGQISPMFKAVKLKIGGIGPGGVRSFDVDPKQLPEDERTVDAEQLRTTTSFLETATTTRSTEARRAGCVVVGGCDRYCSPSSPLAGAVRDALAFWRWVCDPAGAWVTDESARRLLLPSDKGAVPPELPPVRRQVAVRDRPPRGRARRREGDGLYVIAGHGFSVDDDFTVQGCDRVRRLRPQSHRQLDRRRRPLSELSFSGFAEQILVFDAVAPSVRRPVASGADLPFDREPGGDGAAYALATQP